MEIWKDVKDYEGIYQVSNLGNVKSLVRFKKQLKCNKGKYLYKDIILFKNRIGKHYRVHRLVAQAFLGLDINNVKMLVCHKDDNPANNRLDNLFLGTQRDNMLDMKQKGKRHYGKKVNQYDLDGNFIKTWDSMIEVKRELKINNGNISYCCKGKLKTAGGYKWKFTSLIYLI